MVPAHAPAFFIPAGNWAEWAAAIAAGASLILLTIGLLNDRSTQRASLDRERQLEAERFDRDQAQKTERDFLDRSAQAREVGAWAAELRTSADRGVWQVHVINASRLPVRRVRGYLLSPSGRLISSFPEIAVVPAGERTAETEVEDLGSQFAFVLAFDDDAGRRWRKYAGPELAQMPEGAQDLHDLLTTSPRLWLKDR